MKYHIRRRGDWGDVAKLSIQVDGKKALDKTLAILGGTSLPPPLPKSFHNHQPSGKNNVKCHEIRNINVIHHTDCLLSDRHGYLDGANAR